MPEEKENHNEAQAEESEKASEGQAQADSKASVLANRKVLYSIVIIALVALAGWRISTFTLPEQGTPLTGDVIQSDDGIGQQAAADKLVDFLQTRLEPTYPGITVDLISVDSYDAVPGTYEVYVEITFQGQPQVIPYYVTKDGRYMFASVVDLDEPMPDTQQPADQQGVQRNQPANTDIQTFYDSGMEICTEDGKPVIRMYASSSCGYCRWNKPIYEKVVKEYVDEGKIVAYLWEDGKNILSEQQEAEPASENAVYQSYGFTGVPAFVFGCQYYRSGAPYSRDENGEALEEAELRTVIEDLIAATQ